jgi:hypothetical protein
MNAVLDATRLHLDFRWEVLAHWRIENGGPAAFSPKYEASREATECFEIFCIFPRLDDSDHGLCPKHVSELVLQAAYSDDGSRQLSGFAFFLVVCAATPAHTLPTCARRVDVVLWNVAAIEARDYSGANSHAAEGRRKKLKIHEDRVKTGVDELRRDVDKNGVVGRNFSVK